jgi:hypothetical protein
MSDSHEQFKATAQLMKISGFKERETRTLRGKIFHQFREFVAMFLYLWVLFALFTYHESIVLARHQISYVPYGLALFNALVLAKVMLTFENLNLATRFRKRAPIFPILYKSLLFAVIFICFNVAETIVTGVWKGKTIAESIPKIGDGSPAEVVTAALIIAVALIPFFAFRELGRVLGKGVLTALFLHARAIETQMQDFNLNQPPASNN